MTDLPPDIEMVRRRQVQYALEALRELWHRLPFGEHFTLGTGQAAHFKPFFEPRLTKEERRAHVEGEVEAGIDVVFDGGCGHLEFRIYLSGWGGFPAVVSNPEAPDA